MTLATAVDAIPAFLLLAFAVLGLIRCAIDTVQTEREIRRKDRERERRRALVVDLRADDSGLIPPGRTTRSFSRRTMR